MLELKWTTLQVIGASERIPCNCFYKKPWKTKCENGGYGLERLSCTKRIWGRALSSNLGRIWGQWPKWPAKKLSESLGFGHAPWGDCDCGEKMNEHMSVNNLLLATQIFQKIAIALGCLCPFLVWEIPPELFLAAGATTPMQHPTGDSCPDLSQLCTSK